MLLSTGLAHRLCGPRGSRRAFDAVACALFSPTSKRVVLVAFVAVTQRAVGCAVAVCSFLLPFFSFKASALGGHTRCLRRFVACRAASSMSEGGMPSSLALVPHREAFHPLVQALREGDKGLLRVNLDGSDLDATRGMEQLSEQDRKLQPKREPGYGSLLTPVHCERLVDALQVQAHLKILRCVYVCMCVRVFVCRWVLRQ